MDKPGEMFNDGAAYERLVGRWSRRVGATFLDWLGAPSGARWLDVGCGNGAFSEEVATRMAPAAIQGLDPSEGQLAYARVRQGLAGAEFRVGDATSLPYEDNAFDVSTMALVIAFVPDPHRAVAEMARVVRPGGTVAAYMWDIDGRRTPVEPVVAALESIGVARTMPPGENASREGFERLWRGAGMTAIETRTIAIRLEFADFEEYWRSLSAPVGPHARRMRELTQEQLAALRERLRETAEIDARGGVSFGAVANAVKGRVVA